MSQELSEKQKELLDKMGLDLDALREADDEELAQLLQELNLKEKLVLKALKKKANEAAKPASAPSAAVSFQLASADDIKEAKQLWAAKEIEEHVVAMRRAPPPAKHVVFLSHAQADSNALVALLYEKLKQERISCWVDQQGGQRVDAIGMLKGVAECEVFLVVASTRYFARPWCLFELKCAQELGKPVMCIRLDDARQAAITHMQVMESENWLLEQGILKMKLSKHNIEEVPHLKYVDQFVKDLVSRIEGTRQGHQSKGQVEQKEKEKQKEMEKEKEKEKQTEMVKQKEKEKVKEKKASTSAASARASAPSKSFVKDLASRIEGTRQGQQGKVHVQQKTSPPAASAKTAAPSKRPALPTESHPYWGGQYVGEWQNGRPEGRGTLTLPDGNKYEGDWKGGIKEGKGTYFYANGNKYVGDYKNDIREGQGTLFLADGDKYVGDYKNDKREGKGTYFYADGDKYVGDYKNDIREGKGTFFLADGDKYVGDFKNDKWEGKGTYFYANGNKYVGDFKNNMFDGQGTYFYADGHKYVGDFKNNMFDGQGTSFYADGRKYLGQFKNYMFDGQGTVFNANGSISQKGRWSENKFLG